MRAASTCRLPGLGPQVLGRPALAYRRASLRSKRPLHITAAAAGDAALPPQPGGGGGGAGGSSKATPESLGRARQVGSDIVLVLPDAPINHCMHRAPTSNNPCTAQAAVAASAPPAVAVQYTFLGANGATLCEILALNESQLQAMDSEIADKMTDLQRRLTLAERRLQVRCLGGRVLA